MSLPTLPTARADLYQRRSELRTELAAIRRSYDTTGALTDEQSTRTQEISAEIGRIEGALDADGATRHGGRSYDRTHRIGLEERTYRPDQDRTGAGFIGDVARASFGDRDAGERLHRHMQEEAVERGHQVQRAAGTGAFAGTVVPQYLIDQYAPQAKAGRPFADICRHHDLPESGMTVNLSRITTGTSAAVQASENSNVSETDIDDTLMTIPVQTVAGQQTLSRQVIDRGTGAEEIMLADLLRACATALDNTLLNQATNGLTNVATSISYTDASPTAAELYPKFSQAAAAIETNLMGLAQASHCVMSPRRWYWLQKELTQAWPAFAQPGIPNQSLGTNLGTLYGSGARGVLPNGLVAIADANIATNLGAGTNEDEIYIVAADECHLWEDPGSPVMIRAEQTKAASLGVLFVAFEYFAFTHARYAHAQKLTGTGLTPPTW
jgi:HK97 family phage major capsid protein